MLTAYARTKAYISSQLRWNSVEVFNLTQNTAIGEIGCQASWNTGRGDTAILPAQVAVVSSWKTAAPKAIGKKFWGGLTEAALSLGDLDPTPYAQFVAQLLDFIGTKSFTIPGSTLSVIWGVPRESAATGLPFLIPFIAGICKQVLGSQRRRKKGVGA